MNLAHTAGCGSGRRGNTAGLLIVSGTPQCRGHRRLRVPLHVSAQTEVELERPATQLALVLFPHPGGLGARCAVSIAGVHTQAGGVDKPPTTRIALVRVQLVRALVGLQVLGPRELRAADGTDERLVVHMLRGVVRRQLLHGVELLVALPTRLARPRRRPRLLRRLAVVRRRVPTVRRLRAE